jgi:hypothetical protein
MIGRWKVDFGSYREWDDGKFSAGFLVLSSSRWLVLQNDHEEPLIGRALENGEFIHLNSIVRFPSHMSKISSCLLSPWPDKEPVSLKWKVWCSSFVNGAWSVDRPGFLLLRPLAKRVVLLNHENVLIDAHFLIELEVLAAGTKIELPVHRVTIGEPINGDSVQSNSKLMKPLIEDSAVDHKATPPSLSFTRGLEFEKDITSSCKLGHLPAW